MASIIAHSPMKGYRKLTDASRNSTDPDIATFKVRLIDRLNRLCVVHRRLVHKEFIRFMVPRSQWELARKILEEVRGEIWG